MSRKNNTYSKEIKLKAVNMYLNGGHSYQSIATELNIKSKTQVEKWVNQFENLGESSFDVENRGKAKGVGKGRPKKNFSSLEEEVEYLRMENEYLKKLNEITGR
jgi:transposase-like protein